MNNNIYVRTINYFKKNYNIILKITSVFFIIGIIYIYITDDLYDSTISLYPAGELNDSSDFLTEITKFNETLGIQLSNESNYYIPDIVNSYSLKKEIVNKKWKTKKYIKKVSLIEFWEINKSNFLSDIVNTIKSLFRSKFYEEQLDHLRIAVKKIDKLISVEEDYSGLIKVNVLSEEPELSVDMANYIAEYVINYVSAEQKKFAKKMTIYLEQRLNLAKNNLYTSEDNLINFKKKYPLHLDTADLQLKRMRLLRMVEVNQELFITLSNEFELAKIEESKERLFINILDRAEPSIYKAHPKTLLLLFMFTFFGLLFSLSYCIIIDNIREDNN